MKILLLEDDFSLREVIKDELEATGFLVYAFNNGEEAFDSLLTITYDLFLLDINVPGVDGYQFLKEIRECSNNSPAIFISSYSDIDHLSKGYEYGCNDYLRKPFSLQELILRVKEQLKTKVIQTDKTILDLGNNYSYNTLSNTLCFDERPINLIPKERLFIEFLVKNRNRILPTEEIADYVWDGFVDMNSLRVLVYKLRKKLPEPLIENVKGSGYRII